MAYGNVDQNQIDKGKMSRQTGGCLNEIKRISSSSSYSRNEYLTVQLTRTWIFLILILFLASGCIPGADALGNPPGTVALSHSTAAAVVTELVLISTPTLHKPTGFLTENKWLRKEGQASDPSNQTVTWEFYPPGVFRWKSTSDYQEAGEGAWAIVPISGESGIIFLAWEGKDGIQENRVDVLSYKVSGNSLVFGELPYQGTPFSAEDNAPAIPENIIKAASAQQHERSFSLWVAMTAVDWVSDEPPPGGPDRIAFERDGTYTAYFESTQCDFSGTWSLINFVEKSGEIRLSVPANGCDSRGPREAYVREMPVELKGELLFLYQTSYSSIP